MIESIIKNTGVFLWPQIALSTLTAGLLIAYLIGWLRRDFAGGTRPWVRTLDPLAGIAVTIGLLGSVVGFIAAFGGFNNGLDVHKVTTGLANAYYTTGVGLVTSLVATLGSYVLNVISGKEA